MADRRLNYAGIAGGGSSVEEVLPTPQRGEICCWESTFFYELPNDGARNHMNSSRYRIQCWLQMSRQIKLMVNFTSTAGYRAVGAGYNMDQDSAVVSSDFNLIHADVHEVYSGSACLSGPQISQLLEISVRRLLETKLTSGFAIDTSRFCCDVQKGLVDVLLTSMHLDADRTAWLDNVVKTLMRHDWKGAARLLIRSAWCAADESRCAAVAVLLAAGCGTL
ncbi:unnamed protein product [Closterium sp. Yama58-4]|nr:unnamed protein product [Closterium sp. Yama58-4]